MDLHFWLSFALTALGPFTNYVTQNQHFSNPTSLLRYVIYERPLYILDIKRYGSRK